MKSLGFLLLVLTVSINTSFLNAYGMGNGQGAIECQNCIDNIGITNAELMSTSYEEEVAIQDCYVKTWWIYKYNNSICSHYRSILGRKNV